MIVNGTPVMNITAQLFARGAGGFGGPRPPKDPNPVVVPTDRAPDAIWEYAIPENQTLIYRLNGDTMPQVNGFARSAPGRRITPYFVAAHRSRACQA